MNSGRRPLYSCAAAYAAQKDIDCPQCKAAWTVPENMHGVRVACLDCGAAIAIAVEPQALTKAPPRIRRRIGARTAAKNELSIRQLVRKGQLPVTLSDDPDRGLVGMLDTASVNIRSRWLNRSLLELSAIMMAFLLPMLLIYWLAVGDARQSLMPVASLISGILVLIIGCTCPAFAFGAIRKTKIYYFIEIFLAIFAFALFAALYISFVHYCMPEVVDDSFIEEAAGFGLIQLIFVVAICPGVFEEIAFRGIAQSRLTAMYGLRLGAIYTALLFALAHTITLAFPIHVLLGFYLVWLRCRCNSILPGIFFHIGYNASIVLLHVYYSQS